MLVHWQSHQEYLHFLHETKVHLDSSQRMRLHRPDCLGPETKSRLSARGPHRLCPGFPSAAWFLLRFYGQALGTAQRLQQVFRLAAILPSLKAELIPADGLTLSGDGTCVHSHASPYGHKVRDCLENGIVGCSCKRHFSDSDAHWSWDSDEEVFYFGHTL